MTSTSGAEGRSSRALLLPGDLTGPSGGNRYNARLAEELTAGGVALTVEQVPGSWPRPTDDDRRALEQVLARHTDVVVDGIIGSAAPAELARARHRGTRVGVLVHLPLPAEGGLDAPERDLLAAAEQEALQEADTVVATSRWARDDLARRYGLGEVRPVPPGTDPAPPATGSTPPHLLFLGAITPRKGPLALVEALTSVRDRSWTASLVGPAGPDQEYVDAVRARAEGLDGRASLLGPRSDDELAPVWRATDLLVLPSTAETYGMVVTEALAHGIPALVPAGTGAVEALRGSGERDGVPPPGDVVEAGSPTAWAAALARWLDDGGLRSGWRAAAAEHRDRLRGWATTATDFRQAVGW
ncbi:glycosyltransferase family 4 protein [Serinicoccus sediminis]|uniref:glycosyltransferase family 4 protein n=1 Tax=Serinicoccus sediminis TaxID=2306021 RepID=UPI00101F5528|nr:glycosyltransferase family 4 protein [Serinicoccus sediminis]